MKKNKSSENISGQFSFIDILFSTIGTIIFIIAINLLFLASYQGLKSDSHTQLDQIEKTSSIFTPRRIQYDVYGSPIWLNPILIILDNEQPSARYKQLRKFDDFSRLNQFIREIAELNCIYKGRGIKKRYSFIIGLKSDTYKIADDLSQYIYLLEADLQDKYGEDFYPLNVSKIPIGEDEIEIMDKIWEETEIEKIL